ncbi:MAG: citrate/2-methylcitrate synthase [Ruminococcaceae bacterium]|nr:citrate/2-methylcitrate synthase [Oscillospiraceae bacterium]
MQEKISDVSQEYINSLCDKYRDNYSFPKVNYEKHNVKRGLRNIDGTGVVAGVTDICNVHGYLINEGERMPIDGELIYRGINIKDIVASCQKENRFGFEEVIYLLLMGSLPSQKELTEFKHVLSKASVLPDNFTEDVIMRMPSANIMNSIQRSVLALYTFDADTESLKLENLLRQSVNIIAKFPAIIANAYQAKRRFYDRESMFIHYNNPDLSVAENFLYLMRPDSKYTDEEAKLLDLCLILHAEHGGGNNSAFSARVLSSSGTDTYSAISAAVGSLKGHKHGGANAKVTEMFNYIKRDVKDWSNQEEIAEYLTKIMKKEAGDGSGLIYGMGHAVYTISDPRAVILKESARKLAQKQGCYDEFLLMESVEKLTPEVFAKVKNEYKTICANVDMYSGFVYRMLGIPDEIITPLFALARVVGWCSHRIEEIITGGKIIRPAYKSISKDKEYIPIGER